MPDYPDWGKVTAWTFPANISDAAMVSDIGQLTGAGNHAVQNFTDGKTHVLYFVQLAGSIQSKEANNRTMDITLSFTRGLDNGGTAFDVYSARRQLLSTGSANTPDVRDLDFVLPVPFLFKAGSIATPNVFQIALATSSAVDVLTWGVNVISWPLS